MLECRPAMFERPVELLANLAAVLETPTDAPEHLPDGLEWHPAVLETPPDAVGEPLQPAGIALQ